MKALEEGRKETTAKYIIFLTIVFLGYDGLLIFWAALCMTWYGAILAVIIASINIFAAVNIVLYK